MDYKYATGFEALIGYLYLKKNKDRIFKFFEIILSSEKE
jgi:ribonuclease-3 family protein